VLKYRIDKSMVDDELGTDLALGVKKNDKVDIQIDGKGGLKTVSGIDNIVQAIRNRLATKLGELRGLGHPEYGSLLEDVIGEPNTEDTRRIIEALVRESLRHEDRFESIQSVKVLENKSDRNRVDIVVEVKLKTGRELSVRYPFYLER
jgi:phage baseplate assembly protein W